MIEEVRHFRIGHQLSIPRPGGTLRVRHRCQGHTLVEVIAVVLILAVLACVAIPRLNLGATDGAKADAAVHQIATGLRRARASAILHAARNPTGFALVLNGPRPGGPLRGRGTSGRYRIIDLHDSSVIADGEVPEGVGCHGGQRFEFGPLGNLRAGSDTELRITSGARTYTVAVVPATGAVKWTRHDD